MPDQSSFFARMNYIIVSETLIVKKLNLLLITMYLDKCTELVSYPKASEIFDQTTGSVRSV